METLAYTYMYVTQEESDNSNLEAPSLRLFEGVNWKKLPSSAWIRLLSIAVALSILSLTNYALALQKGNQGPQVSTLQSNLRATGYYSGPVTGYYGSLTQASVRRFQAARGLRVDGIAGPRTMTALRGGTSGTVSSRLLQRGKSGRDVTNLQNRLRAVGYYNGPVTGYYGRLTQSAVSNYQAARGLRVDGIAGPRTLAALF
jgi:peptidoglycan hydrolase-like protein with peptidoglycan-binding domain